MHLIGTYYHTLEEKSRVSVPKPFRLELKSESFLTHGLDGCLFIFPHDSWDKLTKKLLTLPLTQKPARALLRLLTYNAMKLEFDAQGRVHLPEHLLNLSGIKKDVVFAGALTRVEVWAKEKYHAYLNELASDSQGGLEESITELGI